MVPIRTLYSCLHTHEYILYVGSCLPSVLWSSPLLHVCHVYHMITKYQSVLQVQQFVAKVLFLPPLALPTDGRAEVLVT